jgi:DNA topoisomerase-1
MEDNLDNVANGSKEWREMMSEFYTPFAKKLETVKGAERVKIAVEETDEICPECKEGKLVVRTGKFGKFLSCNRFPDCKLTKPYVEETNAMCPKDSGKVIIKKTKKGRVFYGCSNYPNCDFAAWKLEDIPGYKSGVSSESSANGVAKKFARKNSYKAVKNRNMVKRVVRKSSKSI